MTAMATEKLREALLSFKTQVPRGGGEVRVVSVEKCEGSAQLLYVRGRLRLGFDYDHVKVLWELFPEGESADASEESRPAGTIAFDEISDSCGGDYDVSVKCTRRPGAGGDDAKRAILAARERLVALVEEWKQAMLRV